MKIVPAAGDAIIPQLNRCMVYFAAHRLTVVATRDWHHPPHHCLFHPQSGPWPSQCKHWRIEWIGNVCCTSGKPEDKAPWKRLTKLSKST